MNDDRQRSMRRPAPPTAVRLPTAVNWGLAVAAICALLVMLPACDDTGGSGNENDTGGGDLRGDASLDGDDDTGVQTDTGNGDAERDSGARDGDDDTGDTGGSDATDTGGDTTEGDASDASDTTTDAGDTSDGDVDEMCDGTLCGMPATCCPAGNECIDGACLTACASGVRCGADQSTCCDSGQLCVADACAAPGDTCADSYDCQQPGEFCEPTLGQCLPQPDPLTCELVPSFSTLSVTEENSWPDEEVISPPFVADIDGDDVPEVVVNAAKQDGGSWPSGEIIVLDGQTMTMEWRKDHDGTNDMWGSHGRSQIALGDVSGDGLPDIVYAGRNDNGKIHALDGFGNELWTARNPDGSTADIMVSNGAATLANFDDDPEAEIVFGASLIDDDGLVVWNEGGNGGAFGTNNGYFGGISAVADLDADGEPEIVSGRDAWEVSWTSVAGGDPIVTVSRLWPVANLYATDGYPAVVDMDLDTEPEVVLVAGGNVVVLDGQTGKLFCPGDGTGASCESDPSLFTQPLAIPGGGRGGPPTIADFDDDGRPEIGIAGGSSYSVYDMNRAGEQIPSGVTAPAQGQLFARWSQATKDQSSNATGSSVFDFQGDGAAEVVYADECYMRVYSGDDGSVQLELENNSATIHEYPLVVDVDADGNSEILIVANDDGNCLGVDPNHSGPIAGVFVFGDTNDEWVPTRRVWTQHTYHVTNATSAGNVPLNEADNWTTSGLNNYRQNSQGEGVFNAPDLAVSLSIGLSQCSGNVLELQARVTNLGALGVPAGVEVAFHEGTDATGPLLGTATTQVDLLPGASTVVTLNAPGSTVPQNFFVVVDGGDTAASTVDECDETNNASTVTDAACFIN